MIDNLWQKIFDFLVGSVINKVLDFVNTAFSQYDTSFLSLKPVIFARDFINYFFPVPNIVRAIVIYCGVMGFVTVYNIVLRIKGFIPTESEG